MKLLKLGERVIDGSIAPLEQNAAEKILNEHRRGHIVRSIELALGGLKPAQLYGIFEKADPDYLYDELNAGRIIWGLDSVLNRSDAEVQTALYFIEKFHKGRRNKTEYAINTEMKDDPKESNKTTLTLSHSGMSNERIFVTLYKQRPVPAQIPADLNKQLQDLIQQKPRYTEYEGYRYHHTTQKSMGQWYSNYKIITDLQNNIVAIDGGSSIVFLDPKRPTISFTGKNFRDELVEHNVSYYGDGSSHFSDATGDPEGFFNTIREYLEKTY